MRLIGMRRKKIAMSIAGSCPLTGAVCAAVALTAVAGAEAPTPGTECRATSGPQTTALVELYTSEGCDSCPPADRWLSSAFPPGARRVDAVPLAFHVDYWDRLGWKDRFAAPAWTERQHAAAHAARSTLIYTPQVLVQGKDLRDWRVSGRSAMVIAAANARPAGADIVLETTARAGVVAVKAKARVSAAADRRDAGLYVALADSGLVSEVKAGENAGARLWHDHVVRTLHRGTGTDGDLTVDVVLPLPAEAGTGTTVVAFVQNVDTGAVVQALALPIACAPRP